MKKFCLVVSVFTVIMLLFTLVSCDFSQNEGGESAEQIVVTYYENNDGELDTKKWISFIGDEWLYYDRSCGKYEIVGERYVMLSLGKIWATGTLSDGVFSLNKDGNTIKYYDSAAKLPREGTVAFMKMVYNKAVELGFEGTLDDLIESLRGESAYDLAVKHGYRGTETQWIASLAGSDGATPSIGSNGHWMVGSVDTGVSAAGTGIERMEKTGADENVDTYTFFLSDGTSYSFTVTNGLDGEAAAKGTGIEKIEKTATEDQTDTYTVTLTDGTSYDFTVKNGRDGRDGRDGIDGRDAPALTIRDVYEEAVANGYAGSYLDFLGDYLSGAATDDASAIRASCFSTVSILTSYKYNFFGAPAAGSSSGTGVIYQMNKAAGDAYVITNYHVVFASDRINDAGQAEPGIADKLFVYLFGSEVVGNEFYTNVDYPGMYMEAEYVGGSMNYDVALLKITGSDRIKNGNAKPVVFADARDVSMGDTVYAVGNGGGDGIAMTKGIVSRLSENLSMTGADGVTDVNIRVMRYDAAVNPGNSGGALFDAHGELVGLVNAKLVDQKYDNVGYAIPANLVKNVVENILYYYAETGETPVVVKKLLFGISYTNSEAYAAFDESTGKIVFSDNLHIVSVGETSLVYGQIEPGDTVTGVAVTHEGVTTEYDLTRAFYLADLTLTIRAGDTVTLTYERTTDDVVTEGQAVVEVTADNLVVSA